MLIYLFKVQEVKMASQVTLIKTSHHKNWWTIRYFAIKIISHIKRQGYADFNKGKSVYFNKKIKDSHM